MPPAMEGPLCPECSLEALPVRVKRVQLLQLHRPQHESANDGLNAASEGHGGRARLLPLGGALFRVLRERGRLQTHMCVVVCSLCSVCRASSWAKLNNTRAPLGPGETARASLRPGVKLINLP